MESIIGSDLTRLVRAWKMLVDQRLKLFELTQTHWIALYNIYQLPSGQSQIQLARAIGIEQPSLVRTLDQLEEKGLIVRHNCPNDRRTKRIILTSQAEDVITKVKEIIDISQRDILTGVSGEQIELFFEVIGKLRNNIQKLQKETAN